MSLAERLAEPPPKSKSTQCLTCREMRRMSDKDAAAVQRAIHDPDWQDLELLDVLHEKGHETITKYSIQGHRQNKHEL